MTSAPDLRQRAADPATPAQELADLAAGHPELRPVIARNPATYDGLLDWLRQYGDADVQAALEARARDAAPAAPPPPVVAAPPAAPPAIPGAAVPTYPAPYGAPARFVEPSRSLPVSYLNHDLRYAIAVVAVGLAGVLSALVLPFLLGAISAATYNADDYQAGRAAYTVISFLLNILPWLLLGAAVFVLPASRRTTMLALGFVAGPILIQLLQTAGTLLAYAAGASPYGLWSILGFFGLLFPAAAVTAWMIARMRPGVSFALLPITLLTIAAGFAGGNGLGGYYYGPSPLTIILNVFGVGVLVGIAWLGRLIAARKALAPTPAERAARYEAQQHAARVAHLQQWQAAAAHAAAAGYPAPGSPPASGYPAPPTAAPAGPPTVPPSTPPVPPS